MIPVTYRNRGTRMETQIKHVEPRLINSIKTPVQHRSFRGTHFLILENILLRWFDGKIVGRQQNSNLQFIETIDPSSVCLVWKNVEKTKKTWNRRSTICDIFHISFQLQLLFCVSNVVYLQDDQISIIKHFSWTKSEFWK